MKEIPLWIINYYWKSNAWLESPKSSSTAEKMKIKHFDSLLTNFCFVLSSVFEPLERIRVIQIMFYFHFSKHIEVSFTSKMFYLWHPPVKVRVKKIKKVLKYLYDFFDDSFDFDFTFDNKRFFVFKFRFSNFVKFLDERWNWYWTLCDYHPHNPFLKYHWSDF